MVCSTHAHLKTRYGGYRGSEQVGMCIILVWDAWRERRIVRMPLYLLRLVAYVMPLNFTDQFPTTSLHLLTLPSYIDVCHL